VVELTLHGLPAEPATLERSRLADSSLSLVRQLEHRIEQRPALAERLRDQRDQALREGTTGRQQLASRFKYAEQLAATAHSTRCQWDRQLAPAADAKLM
jgi:hypothetical protein